MRLDRYAFGTIRIDGVTYDHDIVIAGGNITKRRKKPSKPLRDAFGHTPLSAGEEIPWNCAHLVIGSGASGALPVTDEVREEAERRGVELVILPTAEAIGVLEGDPGDTNAILHLTC